MTNNNAQKIANRIANEYIDSVEYSIMDGKKVEEMTHQQIVEKVYNWFVSFHPEIKLKKESIFALCLVAVTTSVERFGKPTFQSGDELENVKFVA